MDIYIPFTYIIGWSEHKKFYYGAKYAQGCQPSDLWESYFTSSEYVAEFREENGEPDIICIHRTFSDAESCVAFEHEYLTTIDAKNHPSFLNKSNGGKDFGIIDDESKEKKKQTYLETYGCEHAMQSPQIQEKKKQTCLDIYGVEHSSQSPEVKEKSKKTKKRKFGNEGYNNRDKAKKTYLILYGYDNPNKSPQIKQKRKQTNLSKYQCENVFQNESIKQKTKNTLLEKYGVDNISKSETNKKIISEKAKIQRANEPIVVCPYCGLSGKGPNMKRYHFNNCKKR